MAFEGEKRAKPFEGTKKHCARKTEEIGGLNLFYVNENGVEMMGD